MQKQPSWKIEEIDISLNKKYKSILETSIKYKNTINENDYEFINTLLEDATMMGWYPFVSEVFNANEFNPVLERISTIKKDEYIFHVLMLEQEVDILSEFSEVDVIELKARIQKAKELL